MYGLKEHELVVGKKTWNLYSYNWIKLSCGIGFVANLPTNQWMNAAIQKYGYDEVKKAFINTLNGIARNKNVVKLILSDTIKGGSRNVELLNNICQVSTKPVKNCNTVSKIKTFIYIVNG